MKSTEKDFEMETIQNALLLKDAATRTQVAMVYGAIGVFVGVFFLAKK